MILYKYILRNHAGPFAFSLLTLIFIFLFRFLTQYADRLIGKGLSIWIITKLIVFNLAWMVVLVVPMSVLVATLMAYGSMSNNNEISIMKASGVSIYRMMLPTMVVSIILGFLLIQFNNDVYPDANHAARLLLQDISNKKPTLSLVPGLFSQEVSGYSILVRKIDENSNKLEGITIYDYTNPAELNVITAKTGKIYFSENQKKLIMDLNNGEIHQTSPNDNKVYQRLSFQNHKIAMDAEQFSFQQSAPGGMRGDRELSAHDMIIIVDSLKNIQNNYYNRFTKDLHNYFFTDSIYANNFSKQDLTDELVIYRVQDRVNTAQSLVLSDLNLLKSSKENINKYLVEIHKKYSLPAACIIFVLIGAPLGIMTRKGGLGVAAGISVVFFLIYWAFLIGGEKLADRDLITPFWGMWSANAALGIIGILLTVKSAKEKVTLDFSFFKKLIPKQWRTTEEEDDNENH